MARSFSALGCSCGDPDCDGTSCVASLYPDDPDDYTEDGEL